MLINRLELRKLILETLLLERLKKEELMAVVPGMENYADLVNKLNPKYYDKAADFIRGEESTRGENDYVMFGEIIFALLQHQKYSSTNLLTPEVKDIMRLKSYDELRKGLEAIGVPNRKVKDRALYDRIKLLDRQVTEKLKNLESQDYEKTRKQKYEEHMKNTGVVQINKEVRPGLTHLVNVDDWQVLLPSSIKGSQSIGVRSWCTVYSEAWKTYTGYGDTLYYCIKDGKDYENRGYGFDYNENPYDYVCIGFNHANELYIPSGAYEQSVWGDQAGVTRENLNKVMGNETAEKLLSYLKMYQDEFKKLGPKLNASEQAEQQAKLQAIKDAQQNATNLTVFMQNEKDTRVSANELIKRIFATLKHPNISADVSTWIYQNYFLGGANNFKISKSTLFSDPVSFKGAFISAYLSMHGIVPEEIKNDLAIKIIDELNTGMPIRNLDIDSFGLTNEENREFRYLILTLNSFQSGLALASLWDSGLSREVFKKMIDSLGIEEIDSFEAAQASRSVGSNKPEDVIFLIVSNLLDYSKNSKETLIDVMEEYYRLGKFDDIEFIIANKSNGGDKTKTIPYQSKAQFIIKIYERFIVSDDCDESIRNNLVNATNKKFHNASLDDPSSLVDFKYTRGAYKSTWEIDLQEYEASEEDKRMLRELSLENDKISAILKGSAGGKYNEVVSKTVEMAFDSENNSILKSNYENLIRKYFKNHNLIKQLVEKCGLESKHYDMASDQYLSLIEYALMLPQDEFFNLIKEMKGVEASTHGNAVYILRNLISYSKGKNHTAEHRVDIFDYATLLAVEWDDFVKKNPKSKRSHKSFMAAIGRILHGGYDEGSKGNNPKIIRDLITNHTDVALKCALLHLRYADSNDSRHLNDGIGAAYNILVRTNVITYDQAIEEIKNFNELIANKIEEDVDYYIKEFGIGTKTWSGETRDNNEAALDQHRYHLNAAKRGTISTNWILNPNDTEEDEEDEF